MRTCSRPIEVLAYTDLSGYIKPVKMRIKLKDESIKEISIDKILFHKKEKLAGNDMILYRCQSLINDQEKVFEIKYELCTCKWILFKM